jgi:hypothetical protein
MSAVLYILMVDMTNQEWVIGKANGTFLEKRFTKQLLGTYEGVSKSFRTESITKYTLYLWYYSLRSNKKVYGGKTH